MSVRIFRRCEDTSGFMSVTHHAASAVLPAAEHRLFPLQSSEPGVHVLHQLVPVLQFYQLEGLFTPNTHDHRVGKRAGALCLLYGQHLISNKHRFRSNNNNEKENFILLISWNKKYISKTFLDWVE